MPRGWWIPRYPPDWVEHMASAIGNRAMRDLLQPPPVAVSEASPGKALPVPAPVEPPVLVAPVAPAAAPLWRRVGGIFHWRR